METIIVIAQVIATLLVFMTLIVYFFQLRAMERQIRESRKFSSNQMLFELVRYMHELQYDREKILDFADGPGLLDEPLEAWDSELRKSAERVANGFNLTGILVKREAIPKDVALEALSYDAPQCHRALATMLAELRAKRGQGYWSHFDWLVSEMQRERQIVVDNTPQMR